MLDAAGPFLPQFAGSVRRFGEQLAVRQGAKGGADFVSSRAEETNSLDQSGPADALKVVERGGAFDAEALVRAEQNLSRDIAYGSGDGRDDDTGEHGNGLAARDH